MSVALLSIQVKADGISEAEKKLDDLSKSSSKAEGAVKLLTGALGALGVSLGLNAIKNAADGWSDMNARLALTVGSAEKASAVMQRLQSVAKNTYSDINTTTESFISNAQVLRDLGKSTSQALDYTEALNNALVVSGAKAETAASVQEAMSRAMALGKLSGDQLNTVIAKGGEVASVLAAEMGVSTLELRKLGAEGKITGDVIYNALTKRVEELREKAGEMPATMGDAATAWGNAFTTIVGTVDQATGASGALGQALYDMGYAVADQAGTIAQAFVSMQMVGGAAFEAISGALSQMFGSFDVGSAAMIGGIGLATTALVGLSAVILGPVLGALAAMAAAIIANPIGLLIGALASAVAAAYIFRDEISQVLGFDIVDAAKSGVNIIIGTFVGGYEAMKIAWANLPAAIESVMVSTANGVIKAVEFMINKVVGAFNSMFSSLNSALSYVGIELGQISEVNLSGMMLEASASAKDFGESISGAMDAALANDYVGDITSGLKSVWKSAGEATQQINDMNAALSGDAVPSMLGSGVGDGDGAGKGKGGGSGGGGGEKSRAADKLARDMERRLEVLKESFMAEDELLMLQYQKDLETLQWHLDQKKITEQEYLDWKAQVTREHEQEMQNIRLASFSDALGATGELMGAMASAIGTGNDKILKAQKIFGAAQALVNAYIAASQVLADPTIPFWGKFAAVAAVVAKGMSLVAAIKSGSKSGGIGGGSSSSQSSAPEKAPDKRQTAQIKIEGEFFNRDMVANLINQINDMQKDGYVIDVAVAG